MNNVPVTPFMKNLDNPKIMADQEGKFIKYVVIPFWKIMNKFFDGEIDHAVKNLEENETQWFKKVAKLELEE